MKNNCIIIIQARLNSSRFPNKVLEKVNGESMISRVCKAARNARVGKIAVIWGHKLQPFKENELLEKYRYIANKYKAYDGKPIIRLTADCPLITSEDILEALDHYNTGLYSYYSNHKDGHDVQIFNGSLLWSQYANKEHIISDFTTKPTGLSVNTKEDLDRIRKLCAIK